MPHTAVDVAWVLLCAALAFLMQPGFMCLEVGLVRQKNSINVAIKNITDLLISSIVFFIFGFAIMFGPTFHGWFGTDGWLLAPYAALDTRSWLYSFFFFQMVFCGAAATIVSGGVAERMRFAGYMWTSLIVSGLIYPVFGHWAWGGGYDLAPSPGWLKALGYRDFAGSSVVHIVGGVATLACLIVIGPRHGKYNPDGSTNRIWGSNFPVSVLGVFLLWLGWLGFNGGSTLGVTDSIGLIIVNTTLAGCAGSLCCLFWVWSYKKQPEVEAVINGALGGLVAITASCAYVTPGAALIIGAAGGITVDIGGRLLDRFKIDDAVGAVPVHAGAGAVGILALALFSQPEYLLNGSRLDQFLVQLLGLAVCVIFTFSTAYLLFSFINRFITPLRVSVEDEERGLNVAEHGARTPWLDLAEDMKTIETTNDLTRRVRVEPETETGIVARMFNRLMESLQAKTGALVLANQDLTRQKEENETFIYSASHNLRSPLVNLLGFSQELEHIRNDLHNAAKQNQFSPGIQEQLLKIESSMTDPVRYIQTAVGRLSRIIDSLLRLSRAGRVEYHRQEIDLHKTVVRIVDAMKSVIHTKGARIDVKEFKPAWGDPDAIEQVFAKLIENALNYLEPNRPGIIEIGMKPEMGNEIEPAFHTYYVKDNGMGIPPSALPVLFHRFQRYHPEHAPGDGASLVVAHRVIERLGGMLWVESVEGEGSTFFVKLPARA